MATITAIKKNPIVKTIYDRQRAQSKPFKVALVAAMHQPRGAIGFADAPKARPLTPHLAQ